MANSAQSKKRARQAERRRQQNASQRSTFRTHLKKVVKAIEDGDRSAAESALKAAVPVIDRTATKGLIQKNKASRHKSRLSARVGAL